MGNIFMSILLSSIHCTLYRGQSDTKWTILLSWTDRSQNIGISRVQPLSRSNTRYNKLSLNPWIKTGRRQSLAKELAKIRFSGSDGVSFEVLASSKQYDGCLIHGVLQYKSTQSATALFASFADKKEEIKEAIIRAFKYAPK